MTFENGLVNLIDGGSGREWRQWHLVRPRSTGIWIIWSGSARCRLSRSPHPGRARGAGSEFALATDIRVAGDMAIYFHFEVHLGSVDWGYP